MAAENIAVTVRHFRGLEVAEHAFKTPGLREIGRSAPYMHDGSLATLEDVLRHYVSGLVDRPTLSKDLTRGITLSAAERADLILP